MPVRDILSAASGASGPAIYIDDVFSTYLYTGTGATQSINNGIDLAGKGGLTWIKSRSAATNNNLFDTTQGATKLLHSNTTAATVTDANSLTAFNSNGFTLGTGNTTGNQVNTSTQTYASWTFRKQAKFFDVVTYTGTGSVQNINHNLGSVPGMIIVKDTGRATNWRIYNRGLNGGINPAQYGLAFNTTSQTQAIGFWNDTAPTSTQFTVNTDSSVNTAGATYVAYLFAHNAGGFGTTGTDNVISCGSFTTDGSGNASVNLGYEPQYLLIKSASAANVDWYIADTMRGLNAPSNPANTLAANRADAETIGNISTYINSTGFSSTFSAFTSTTFIYMAIRRPMKPPTSGTQVFSPVIAIPSGATTITTNFASDLLLSAVRDKSITSTYAIDRLRGDTTNNFISLVTNTTGSETNATTYGVGFDNNTAIIDNFWNTAGGVTTSTIYWNFRRASGFFDEVCYTGTGVARTVAHNLTVAPELMIVKRRDTAAGSWYVYVAPLGSGNRLLLETTGAVSTGSFWNNTDPTSTVFSLNNGTAVNASGGTYVAYLFATLAGVSKVGSYTGTGATQTINCGFTGGARFVLIKRTDSTGDWYVWDTARGMVSGTDPSLLLNSTAAEVNANSIYTVTTGFQIVSTAAGINASGGSYIFLAIA